MRGVAYNKLLSWYFGELDADGVGYIIAVRWIGLEAIADVTNLDFFRSFRDRVSRVFKN